jgi:hypothetical protein
MRWSVVAAGFALACLGFGGPAQACSALAGSTGWDSVFKTYGDPFFGGSWSNSKGGSAYIQRSLKSPAKITGFYMRIAGSDVTADGSRILVRAKLTADGTWKTLMDVRDIVIGRDFSGGVTPRRMGPITVTFPETEVSALRIDMTGNGWFAIDQTMFFVRGCSAYSG